MTKDILTNAEVDDISARFKGSYTLTKDGLARYADFCSTAIPTLILSHRAQAVKIEELESEDKDIAFVVFERVDGLFPATLKRMAKFSDSCEADSPERHAVQTCIGHLVNLNNKVFKMMENWPDD